MGQEHVEQRVRESNQGPGEPDEARRKAELLRREETSQVHCEFAKGESSFLAVSRRNRTASFEFFHCDAALPTVLGSYHMEIIDEVLFLALPKKEFGSLVEADYGNTQYAKNEDEDAV